EGAVERMRRNLETEGGRHILELGVEQAARATTDDRRQALVGLLASGLGGEGTRPAESKKLLSILAQLLDEELLVLYYHSRENYLSSAWHADLQGQHPDILEPHSKEMGASEEVRA